MATDYVIDTNVWVMVDKVQDAKTLTSEEIDCITAAIQFLRAVRDSEDRIVVDGYLTRKILTEYRGKIAPRGLARDILNRLERLPRERLVEIDIAYDTAGHAILPFHLSDPQDRKFAAVALAHTPTPPIIDATDTDWEKAKDVLTANGLVVTELCLTYIQKKLANK